MRLVAYRFVSLKAFLNNVNKLLKREYFSKKIALGPGGYL